MVQIRITDKKGANRFGYEKPFEEFVDLTDQLKGLDGEPERRLAIINKLLAGQRRNARDHERGGVMFHGAALVKTRQGNWLLSSNIHVHNSDTSRNCAEALATSEAHALEGRDTEIAELYFMGGRANFDERKEFLGNEGQRISPCGSCLDAIYNHNLKVDGGTVVHMLPLNDGNQKLSLGDPQDPREENELKDNEVFSRTIGKLLPRVSAQLSDPSGDQKRMIARGYDWIHNQNAWKAISNAVQRKQLVELEKLDHNHANPDGRLIAINKLLMDTAKDYYQKSNFKPTSMTIAIVRDTEGKYYLGKYSKDGVTPATPSAEYSALKEMTSHLPDNRLTDIFIVNISHEELVAIKNYEDQKGDITVQMPDGATREILKKFSSYGETEADIRDFFGRAMESSNARIHVFLPNNTDVKKFHPHKHVIHMTVRELLPYAFKNPKSQGAVNGH